MNQVEPHTFVPYRWLDRLHRRGRCRHCVASKQHHPVPIWIEARALGDGRYHTPLKQLGAVLRGAKATLSQKHTGE